MSVRSLLWGGAFAFVAIYPSTTLAQAPWIPPKGEVDVAVTYQWLDSDRHLLSGLTGPELTPLEVAYGCACRLPAPESIRAVPLTRRNRANSS